MKKLFILICIFLMVQSIYVNAQEGVVTSGGDAVGSGGYVSYSIGQVFYTVATDSYPYYPYFQYSITAGLQQPPPPTCICPFVSEVLTEIPVLISQNNNSILLKMTNDNIDNFYYQLYDIQGKILENKKIENMESIISIANYSSGSYFIRVNNIKNQLTTFKIIKL